MYRTCVRSALAAALMISLPALAEEAPVAEGRWTGSGELGLTSATGNTRTQNINALLSVGLDEGRWHHDASVFWLRSRGEVEVVSATTGTSTAQMEDTANRYGAAFSSAFDLSKRSYLIGSVRYDHDNFASYLWRGVAAASYGYRWRDDARMRLVTEIGPGFRRSHDASSGAVENEGIARGLADFGWQLNDSTRLMDTLLVESGRLNTFVQNDLGLQVSMSERLALKVGYQVRYNSDVDPGFKKTDTVTMLNLVYSVK
jgi:putative salt-induced outer membrane protein